ncbi:RsiV family protein [Brevibacillus halotolerans]|uniref:RsiV family protein n=1 Tax=Brevibacillus halotolerans TaxID=1507437 RepID=UPI001BB37F08
MIKKETQKHIKKNENAEFFTFTSISDTRGFLVKDGNLVIKFVQYEIGPRSLGTPTFSIPFSSLKDYLSDNLKESLLQTVKI